MSESEAVTVEKTVPKQFRKRKQPDLKVGQQVAIRETKPKLPDIPLPPSATMGYNSDFPSKQFFDYWQTIDREYPARLIAYVYRYWPVIDRERSQQHLAKGDRVINIGKHVTPFRDELQVYHQYGAGDYEIKLNDPGRAGGSLCRLYLRGFRDMQTYEPAIDQREIVMEDPVNRPYIQWAKSHGILKDGTEQGEEEMANVASVEAIGSLVEGMKDMAQQAVEQADKRAETSRVSEAGSKSMDVDAAAKSMEIVSQAATMGTKMIESAVLRAQELSNPSSQAAALDKMLDVAAKFAGMQNKAPTATPGELNTGKLLEMFMERETKLQASVLSLTEARFKDLENRIQQPNAGQGNPLDPLSQTRSMLSFFKELDEFRGGGETVAAGKTTIWDNLPKMLTGLAALGSVIVSGMHNAAVLKTGQGTPIQAQIAAPETEGEQPALQIPGQTQVDPNNPMAQYHRFLEGIRVPMLGMMNDESRETPGADFADWLMESQGGGPQGRQFYEGLKQQGPDSIKALFQSYPPLWSQLAQMEAKFDAFMEGFFNHDEIRQSEADLEQQDPVPVRPVRKVRAMPAVNSQADSVPAA